MYQAAFVAAKALGGALVQINHPQWFWGMTGDLLAELARRGARARRDREHPVHEVERSATRIIRRPRRCGTPRSSAGSTLWGVASDDAHDYADQGTTAASGPRAAAGSWSRRGAIRRRSSTRSPRVTSTRRPASCFARRGRRRRARGRGRSRTSRARTRSRGSRTASSSRPITARPRVARCRATGYLRAVVTRDDGTEAWVQPARADVSATVGGDAGGVRLRSNGS